MLCKLFVLSSSIFPPLHHTASGLYSITSSKFRCDCPAFNSTSSWPLILTAFAFASLGWPCGHRLLWARLDLPFPFLPLAEVLIPFHGCKISDPELFPQGCQPPSCLQKAHGIRIAQHRRADGLPGEPRSLAQPHKQEGKAILGQRTPPFGEQEPIRASGTQAPRPA